MLTITVTNDHLVLVDGDSKKNILKSNIIDISLPPGRDYVLIDTVSGGAGPKFYKIPFVSVESPVVTSASELFDLLISYWTVISGDYQVFTATAGQTVFTVTDFNLHDNYLVFINGTFTPTGHSRSANVVTFSAGILIGTEVTIMI